MRRENWQTLFHRYLDEARSKPFQWGTHDCVLFAKGCVEAISDRVVNLDVQWTDEESARGIVEQLGGLEEAVSAILGPPVPWGWCGAGDIVQVGDFMLAVHDGSRLVAPGLNGGLVRLPFAQARVGWRV